MTPANTTPRYLTPPSRYDRDAMPYDFTTLEREWQQYWLQNRTFRAFEPAEALDMPKSYVLDMFPYPSGAGLHVGHPEGYTATDIISRYLRMKGHNVLHPMGWDAFGLPAEQYAIKTNTHPKLTTEQNIATFRRQIQILGLSYDWDREIDTTDPAYYKWTQWIFLQIFNNYFDPVEKKARPISHLINELSNENYVIAPDHSVHLNPTPEGMEVLGGDVVATFRFWHEFSPDEQRQIIDDQRLAYTAEIPVNWCPALGTVLANEEIIDGKSEIGGFPVEKRPMRQWMLRITAYADRLLADLDLLEWPESLKEMQRNWIGKSTGAEVDFELSEPPVAPDAQTAQDEPTDAITVFTTRPDTLYGATYMVLAPEHPLVNLITTPQQRPAVQAYIDASANKSERDRLTEAKDKTGAFTGAYAVNPVNQQRIPIWIADYVLMGYGTGAIMAVPAHDERDFKFATKFNLPIVWVVRPADKPAPPHDHAFVDDGIAINSPMIDGLPTEQAKAKITAALDEQDIAHPTVKYKLRDWLFSRQRYWGEPFPILLDQDGNPYAIGEDELPLQLPEMADFKPTGTPEPPLSKAKDWLTVESDSQLFTRETNTMPQWAGSCWYYLRYIDPRNPKQLVDPAKEKYWMPVDLYVGGVEHAVLHLLYARFWHKVLFDLRHVSTPEPFQRLVNQGLILGEMEYTAFYKPDGQLISLADLRDIAEEAAPNGAILVAFDKQTGQKCTGTRVPEDQVEKTADVHRLKADKSIRVDARSFKMSKSRGNVVNPDDIVREYGADCFRLYEMYMGPLEASKPWNTRDIVGMSRFLNSVWRNFVGETRQPAAPPVADSPIPDDLDRQMHRTIKKVAEDIELLRFNTAIAELIKLNNEMTRLAALPRKLAETFVLLLSPFAPHIAEELWSRLGHPNSLAREPWPTFDPARLLEQVIELPVQVNGKLRDRISVPADADEPTIFQAAQAAEKVRPYLQGKTILKRLYVPMKLVSIVVK